MKKIRVMVVDDSAFMRKVISDMLASDPNIEVTGTARNGLDALEKIRQQKPDLITLDVEMPQMGGLELLKRLMERNPIPVIMLSSLTKAGAEDTMRALSLGAVDFVPKPSGSISLDIKKIQQDLLNKVKIAAKVTPSPFQAAISHQPALPKAEPAKTLPSPEVQVKPVLPKTSFATTGSVKKIVAIGTSTGGPRALQEVLPKLPANLPAAILVVQHMPKGFTQSLAQRLNQQSNITIREAKEGDRLENGLALLAPGGLHMTLEKGGIIGLNEEPPVLGVRPAVDILFKSIAQNYGGEVVGVIMTGMGRDGTEGLTVLKDKGTKAIAEDKSTCVVYGMPKSVVDKGLADRVVPLPQIANEIVKMIQGK